MNDNDRNEMVSSGASSAPRRASPGFWIGLFVVLGATGYIVTSSMANTVHYYEVDEVTAESASLVGTTMRLRGVVVEGSHQIRQGSLDEHVFLLTAGDEQMTVLFAGALPDQFRDGASVIATGALTDAETFQADSMTAQCPSRYENEPPTTGGGYQERAATPEGAESQ